ncbi:MAG: MFS transporter [Holosporales bacterium]
MPHLSLSVLRRPDFRHLFLTRMFGVMALQAQAVIVGWQVYSITKDPFMLGLVGLTEAAPAILSALVSGHVVDTHRPFKVYTLCLGALVLNTLLLWAIAGEHIAAPGGSVLPWIFAGVFISGVARSFIMPSSFSLVPQVVPRSEMPASSAWLSSGFQMATIMGPAVAGLLYAASGAAVAWLMPVGLTATALLSLLLLSPAPRRYQSEQRGEPAIESIKAGWRFLWHHPVLLSIMALDMFAVLFGGAVAMLPAYADQVLQTDASGLGLLRAAPAVGAIITALALALLPMRTIRGTTLMLVITGFGLCMIGFGLSTVFWLSALLLLVGGAFDSVSMVIRSTVFQLLTPAAMRGRVSAVNSMFIISSNEIGAFYSGVMARFLGLVPGIIVGGVGTLVVVAIAALRAPNLRRMKIETRDITP